LVARTVGSIIGMLSSIKFDYEALLATNKIHNVRAYWLLANEFIAERPRTKAVPKA
jgi:hypothetical protein